MGMFAPEVLAAMQGGVLPPAPRDYHLPTKFPSFDRAYRVAIDLESHDPDIKLKGPGWRRNAYIVGCSVALQDKDGSLPFAEYYPVAHRTGPNLDGDRFMDWLSTELAFYQGEVVGTNLLYDADGLQYRDVGAPMAKWRDIQWAEALIDENAPNYQLRRLAMKYLGETKVTDELKALYGPGYIERFREIHPGHARAYGLGDVRLPLRVLLKQEEVLKKEKLVELYDIESRLLPMLIYMRRLGMRVDLEKAANLGVMFSEKRDEALAAASKLCGVQLTADNFGKPGVLDMVFSNLGIAIPRLRADDDRDDNPKTWTGKPTVKKVWLENTLEHPIGDLLAAAGAFDKAKGTFVDGYITDYVIGDRIHCELHPLRRIDDFGGGVNGTVSGRFSGSNPNLQNIPSRDDVIGPLCRSMFIPDEGCDFWSADYSQIEFRLLVHLAAEYKVKGWEVPVEMYRNDPKTDFHKMVAALTGLERKYAKSINFGLAFCMGVNKLAFQLGKVDPVTLKPLPEAKVILDQYHEKVPFVREVSHAATAYARKHGYIATLLGRRSRFSLYEPKDWNRGTSRPKSLPFEQACAAYGGEKNIVRALTHKALNRFTQGSAADIIKVAMVQAWEAGIFAEGTGLRLGLQVHDELDGSIERSPRGKESLRALQDIMINAIPLHVPVLVEATTGANWAETH